MVTYAATSPVVVANIEPGATEHADDADRMDLDTEFLNAIAYGSSGGRLTGLDGSAGCRPQIPVVMPHEQKPSVGVTDAKRDGGGSSR